MLSVADTHHSAQLDHHRGLHIEDNPANLRLMEDILEELDHPQLICAKDPHIEIDLALTQRPELTIFVIYICRALTGMMCFICCRIILQLQIRPSLHCRQTLCLPMPKEALKAVSFTI